MIKELMVLAAEEVQTNVLNGGGATAVSDNGKEIFDILGIILNVMTVGVVIAGIAGILMVAIRYTSAGANEQQVAIAKRRILEIVIGLAIWAVFYMALRWLIPGFGL